MAVATAAALDRCVLGQYRHPLDYFNFTHVSDHFVLVGLLDPDAVNVFLMLSSVESTQLAILNSIVFVIQTCIFE
jgi:hypothetical protein